MLGRFTLASILGLMCLSQSGNLYAALNVAQDEETQAILESVSIENKEKKIQSINEAFAELSKQITKMEDAACAIIKTVEEQTEQLMDHPFAKEECAALKQLGISVRSLQNNIKVLQNTLFELGKVMQDF